MKRWNRLHHQMKNTMDTFPNRLRWSVKFSFYFSVETHPIRWIFVLNSHIYRTVIYRCVYWTEELDHYRYRKTKWTRTNLNIRHGYRCNGRKWHRRPHRYQMIRNCLYQLTSYRIWWNALRERLRLSWKWKFFLFFLLNEANFSSGLIVIQEKWWKRNWVNKIVIRKRTAFRTSFPKISWH